MSATEIIWGFGLRFGQAVLEASLTLMVGLIVAGVFRRMVGPANVRRLFGGGAKGLLKGWTIGMLLPVCSLGVIPVALEMRRVGVRGGTILAFVLAAPLLNPISFLYGLTLAEPIVIFCFAAGSLLTCTLAGLLWDRIFSRGVIEEPVLDEPLPAYGPKRLLAVAATAAKYLTGWNGLFYTLGILGSAMLTTFIPFGALQNTMAHSDWTSPALMTALGIPIYSSPLPGMMKIGLMFDHGNSIGAAYVLFALGIGVNVGLITWLVTAFRPIRVLAWLGVYAVGVMALGYTIEPLLYDERKEEIDHTHAFDDYSNPFGGGGTHSQLAESAFSKLADKCGPLEQVSLGGLVLFGIAGVVIRRLDRDGRVERWLISRDERKIDQSVPWWNRPVPGPVLGAITLAGLVAFSVIGAYIFYPDKQTVFDQMTAVRADATIAVMTGHDETAMRQLDLWDDLTRKLQVGVYIREGRLPEGAGQATETLREEIERVHDFLRDGDPEGAKKHVPVMEKAYRKVRDLYLSDPSRE